MSSPKPRVPEGLIIALAVLSSFAIVVGGLWLLQRRSPSTQTAQAPPTTTFESPTTAPPATAAPTTPPPTPAPTAPAPTQPEVLDYLSDCPTGSEVDGIICDLVHFVETTRGRPFKTFPTVELEENAVFDQRLLSDFDAESDDLRRSGETLRSLGLIPADADLVELFRASLEVGVVGFYRTDSEELVVRGGELGLYEQSVLVHELVHAFDDQWFDLDRPEFEDSDDEGGAGFTAVVEGNASRVDELWTEQLSDQERAELRLGQATALSPSDIAVLQSLPRFMLELQISPYTDGLALVTEIEASGGESAVDEALDNPPVSTEQVLHPDDFFEGETPLSVDTPRPDGTQIDSGVFGELGLRAWLGPQAAEGWGGDSYVTYETDDQVCTQLNLVMDTDTDQSELLSAATRWAGAESQNRSVTNLGRTVVIIGCV